MTAPTDDDFPLLTDVLESTPSAPAPPPAQSPTLPAPIPASTLPSVDWEEAEIRLRNRLLIQLAPLLQEHVRTLTAEILQQTASRLTSEICLELEQPLEELIRQTVAEEIQRLRDSASASLD